MDGGQREGQARLRAGQRTRRRRSTAASTRTSRDEHLGDAVGQARDRRLGALRPLDEVDDPGESRVAPDARRAHDEAAGPVERGADDLVARADLDRDRLAGQHRDVDARAALHDRPVDRDGLAGPDAQEVADRDDLERDLAVLGTVDDETRRLRAQTRSGGGWRRPSGPSPGPRASDRAGRGR